ncbi:hypothetical protein PAPHI01_1419 [Pancytospora philotis]|nr:hypothetical protein PAPHI01_1419 [Pancytospora philotis]
MTPLQRRLAADYTLLNLNDPTTTHFYTGQLDYLIETFPYFKDQESITAFFTSTNAKFNARFHQRMEQFLGIVEYSDNSDSGNSKDVLASLVEDRREEAPADSSTTDSEACATFDSYLQDSLGEPPSSSCESIELPALQPRPRESLRQLATPADFTVHSKAAVLQSYARVLTAHLGSFALTPGLIQSMVGLLEHDCVQLLLLAMLQRGLLLPILLENGCVARILREHPKSLCALLEGIFCSSLNDVDDEERFMDQVEQHRAYLVDKFLKLGIDDGCVEDFPEAVAGRAEGTGYINEAYVIYKILHTICLHRSSIKIRPCRVLRVCRFSLYYLRLLSFDATPLTAPFLGHLVELFYGSPSNSHLLTSVSRIFIRTSEHALKETAFFQLLHRHCYSYAASERASSADSSVAARLESTLTVGHGGLEAKQPSFAPTEAHIANGNLKTIFAFILRLYLKFASFIKIQYPSWDVLHELMDVYCKLEKAKSTNDDLELLAEYEGFQRYIVDHMLSVLPCSSIFLRSSGAESSSTASEQLPREP